MPVYEYQCVWCKKITPIMKQKSDGGPKRIVCRACGYDAYKILSPVNFNLIPDGNPSLDPEPDEVVGTPNEMVEPPPGGWR